MSAIEVSYISHMGSDSTVVNNARVSFAKRKNLTFLGEEDKRLIGYLARGCTLNDWDDLIHRSATSGDDEIEKILKSVRKTPTHWAPFANGCQVQFHIKAPIPIMRQVFKHKVGAVESEVSRRYVTEKPEVFRPTWRKAANNVKQGSSEETFVPRPMPYEFDDGWFEVVAEFDYDRIVKLCLEYYDHLILNGVCAEQARFVLPQGVMTEALICNSLYGWANFYNQRSDTKHAQREVAYLAEQVGKYMSTVFPVSWKALTK